MIEISDDQDNYSVQSEPLLLLLLESSSINPYRKKLCVKKRSLGSDQSTRNLTLKLKAKQLLQRFKTDVKYLHTCVQFYTTNSNNVQQE